MLFNKNGILLYLLICHLFYLFVWLCWILIVEPKISLHPARIFIAVNGLPSRGIASCDTHSGLVAPQQVGFLVPWLGIEPKSPALQGRFLTTGLPGKSYHLFHSLCVMNICSQLFEKAYIYIYNILGYGYIILYHSVFVSNFMQFQQCYDPFLLLSWLFSQEMLLERYVNLQIPPDYLNFTPTSTWKKACFPEPSLTFLKTNLHPFGRQKIKWQFSSLFTSQQAFFCIWTTECFCIHCEALWSWICSPHVTVLPPNSGLSGN